MSSKGETLLSKANDQMRSAHSADGYIKAAASFEKAGNYFRSTGKNFKDAGFCYMQSAKCQEKSGNAPLAASQASLAARMYTKVDHVEATSSIRFAIALYRQDDNQQAMARNLCALSSIFESDGFIDLAAESIYEASAIYESISYQPQAASNLERLALILCTQKKWHEAAIAFQHVSELRLQNQLTQLLALSGYFQSLLCFLADGDAPSALVFLERYLSASPFWRLNEDCAFISSLIEPVNHDDYEEAARIMDDYATRHFSNKWIGDVFIAIKAAIENSNSIL